MMNGYNDSSLYNLQYSNNVQSQIYPPHSEEKSLGSSNYGNNHSAYNDAQLNQINPLVYNNDSYYVSPITQPNSQMMSYNNDYSNQTLLNNSSNFANNTLYPNASQSVPTPIAQSQYMPTSIQPPYLPPAPSNVSYQSNKPQIRQTPTMLSDQMKNLQINPNAAESIIDLMQSRNLFTEESKIHGNVPKTCFPTNCDETVMQCTLNSLPVESSMLSKSRLPLGVHIQPFRDTDITLVQTNTIVRCRSCRTYINPFVQLTDQQRKWHCNACGRVNDIPDEFMYDPTTKTYGSPSKRPELRCSNIEYTANPDYTVRPPMAAVYVFCLDVSQSAITSGYLRSACDLLIENLQIMPGDGRKQIAFLTYNSSLHYYQIQENTFKTMVWSDISEVDLPVSDDLLVSIDDRKDIIMEFLNNLPLMFTNSMDSGNCMGYAIQVAMKLITHNGGRITVVNSSMPSIGPGSLSVREGKENDAKLIQPSTDFYKSLALQCANDQISVDLFCINNKYSDIASFVPISRHSSGAFHYYGNFKAVVNENQRLEPAEQLDFDRFSKDFRRYLTRKIGFEAVMRTRFSKGLELTAFHGNLFMRSTNVIALPVVNPDASYSIQFKINGSLVEWNYVIIQSALLYTSSDSDRRIRVHTLCLPVTDKLEQLFMNANGTAIAGLVAKIAIDRCASDGLQNVREAFVNSLVDPLRAFNQQQQSHGSQGGRLGGGGQKPLLCPHNLRLLAPFVLGILRCPAFRECQSIESIDYRVAVLESIRWLPLADIVRRLYPHMVAVHQMAENVPLATIAAGLHGNGDDNNDDADNKVENDRNRSMAQLGLTSANISRDGAFLLDNGDCFYLLLGASVPSQFLKLLLPSSNSGATVTTVTGIDRSSLVIQSDTSLIGRQLARLCRSIGARSLGNTVVMVTPDSALRSRVLSVLVEDRMETAMSYYEFLRSVHASVYA